MFVYEIIDEVIEILGRCDRQKALLKISDAVQALQDEGDWNANIGMLDIRTFSDGATLTLPREVETPIAVIIDGIPVFMRDEFYRFHLNGEGLVEDRVVPWVWDDVGFVGSFMDIVTPGPAIARCDLIGDAGKLVRIMGYDQNDRPLRDQLENGEWIDGVSLELVQNTSAPTAAPTSSVYRRLFRVTPITRFVSNVDHELVTGAYMQVVVTSGSVPTPIQSGAKYYVRVVDLQSVTLHSSRLDARTGQSPIELTTIPSASTLLFSDSRAISSRTQFQTSGNSNLLDFDRVIFSGAPLPSPLNSSSEYFVRVNGADKFRIFTSLDDAQNEKNVVNVSTPGTNVSIQALKETNPVTAFNFNVRHNFQTGDAVTASNSGGQLPSPLIAGVNYFVRTINSNSLTLHETLADSVSGANPISLTDSGTGTSSLVKVIPCSIDANSVVTTVAPHGLNTPQGSGGAATASTTNNTVTGISITNGGSGYEAAPIVTISGGGGTGATAQAFVSGGVVTQIVIITGGTGYTTPPTVSVVAAGGSFVSFTTNGTFPSPISQGTVYRAESPINPTNFVLNDTVPRKVNITSLGSGQLFLTISRSFAVGFLPQWKVDATAYSTGQEVRFYSPSNLPTCSPTIDPTTIYYIRKTSNEYVEVYTSLAEATNLASTAGRISVVALGSGKLYFSSQKSVLAVIRDNFLDIEFAGYLLNFADVKFETTGSLPSPLLANTNYQLSIVDGKIEVYDTSGNLVNLTGIGNGQHTMNLSRNFSIVSAASLDVPDQQYVAGDSITVSTDGLLPLPLNSTTTYFVRPISPDLIELYGSQAQAQNTSSTAGRIVYTTIGEGNNRLLQNRAPRTIKSIERIEKPETDGFCKIYAWDTGRTGNIALLADMQPQETTTSYRRIRIKEQAKWVRMKYRRKSVRLTTEKDFINLDSKMAILMMVQSQDLLIKRFAEESERYRLLAVEYLKKRNRALEGPRVASLQINADIMSRPDDWLE